MDLHKLEGKMNRFRARRKAKEHQQTETSFDFDAPSGLLFGPKSFGKNKKPIPESKPAINLATALPSTNDFRTSLIMPNLSARFSMLREQDDPSTKIGKANDDSVLFPKRASRLNLFSHNPLTDIAEDDSIRESIRPPFACGEGKHSFDGDGYDSDGASIMNRSRLGEGNTLFGGRQKLYKIPAESPFKSPLNSETSQSESAGMGGRVMYENDVSLSLFQKYRQEQRQERSEEGGKSSLGDAEDEVARSPATSFSKDRGTTSSTTSGPRRNSTAATSFDSQSIGLNHNNSSTSSLASPKMTIHSKSEADRNNTVYRKIYGQALQQSDPLQPLAKDAFDHLNPQRAVSNDQKVSVALANKRISDHSGSPSSTLPSHRLPNFRSASPPPSASPSGTTSLESKLRDNQPALNQMHGCVRPLSPPASDGEDTVTFANSLQPEDRGKATAMGLFNKPSRKYDEQQFSQRQVQMHRGRISPVLPRASPTPTSTPASPDEVVSTIRADKDLDQVPTPTENARARAASLIRRQNEELSALEAQRMASHRQPELRANLQDVDTPKTFLVDDDTFSSPEDEAIPSILPHEVSNETHPAFRRVVEEFKFGSLDDPPTTAQSGDDVPICSAGDDHARETLAGDGFDPTSERLGLSGLIRTHLRTDSDKSSIYPPVPPRITSTFANDHSEVGPRMSDTPVSPRITPSSATDRPQVEARISGTSVPDKPQQSQLTDAQIKMAENAKQFLSNARFLKNHPNSPARGLSDEEHDKSTQASENFPTWQDTLQSRHQRDGSTETQQEREAFHNELAERRRKVQETFKNVVESNSRSATPVLDSEPALLKPNNGLSAKLRSKSSRAKPGHNPPMPPDHSVKAMKLLGLGSGSSSNVSTSEKPEEQLWKEEEERMLQDFDRRSRPKPTFRPSPTRTFPRIPLDPSVSRTSRSEDSERSRQRSATPLLTHSSARDRSASELSARSRSRNGQRRHDLDKPGVEGSGNHGRIYRSANASNTSIATRPTIEIEEQPERSISSMSGRYRSNSRSNTPGYFDSQPLKPIQTNGMSSTSLSSRPSPRTPYSANSTPPIFETPAVTTPHSSVISLSQPTDGRTTPSLRGRKRSITKNMISDPTFVSTTYAVTTVDLPPGASLRNGSPDTYQRGLTSPAIPFMNPARRRGRVGTGTSTTHTILSTLTGRANDSKSDLAGPLSARPALPEERSTFSDEAEEKKPVHFRPRQRLRKVSSEGGDMNAKARYQALMAGPSPALPTFPVKRGPSPPMRREKGRVGERVEGGMF